jgi:signal transduction histidine kinase
VRDGQHPSEWPELALDEGPAVGEVLAQLLSGVAHELANTAFGIRSQVDFALDSLEPTHPARAEIESLELVSTRTARLAAELQRLRRVPGDALERMSVEAVTRPLVEAARSEGVDVELHADADLPEVAVPASELRQAVGAVLTNACEAIAPGGSVRVRAHAEARGVWLRVQDDGRGMSESLRARALRPFVTTKSRAHLGLGLTIARVVVARAGGRLRIASVEGQGTEVALWLPRAE